MVRVRRVKDLEKVGKTIVYIFSSLYLGEGRIHWERPCPSSQPPQYPMLSKGGSLFWSKFCGFCSSDFNSCKM